MNRDKATSLDVARKAGVSQSAVSRVFTPGASVSDAMIKKVRNAAEELGYRPNALARSLITQRSHIIGLVVAYLDNPFYPLALQQLSHALQDRGYHILVFMAGNESEKVSTVVQEIIDYQVDGIITASVSFSNDLTESCSNAGIPVVMFNRDEESQGHPAVTAANKSGGRKVAEFLIAGGHQRIAHIAGWRGASTGRDREKGLVECLDEHGQKPLAIIDGLYSRETAAAAARELMALPEPPDAIFVGNDHMAFPVMDVLRHELGLSIPDDVSIVGFDDVPLAAWNSYDLTTVRQPLNRMVEATVATLIDCIDGVIPTPRSVEFDGPLIVRGSARIPPNWQAETVDADGLGASASN